MRMFLAVVLAITTMAAWSTAASAAQTGGACTETGGHQLCGQFRAFWEANDGPTRLGSPVSDAFVETRFDSEISLDVQYFERGRLELHPGNAGTPYTVQLGRLGAEVLATEGRDWQSGAGDDPGMPNYQSTTGFAIAPEFFDYWSTNGVELGDDGVSFRESLALFGYPISTAHSETDANGEAVVTQWFERARLDLRGGRVMAATIGIDLLDIPGAGDPALAAMLAQVQASVARFADPDVAGADGWGLIEGLDHCFDNPGVGAMGIHYINANMLDMELDLLLPEAMVYQHQEDGSLRLGAVEWIVPAEPWDAAQPGQTPELLGTMLHLNETLGVYVLHAWIFNENPSGVLEDWNPNVICPL